MSGSKRDDQKTKQELIAEIQKLRSKLSEDEAGTQGAASREPTLSGDISRREALKIGWVTPVILSVPLASIVGARRAQAQLPPQPTEAAPTMLPTMLPTMAPTTVPTVAPTVAPTTAPTVAPTTAASTAFPSARAVPAMSAGAAAAVAAGLFGFGVKRLQGASKSGTDADAADDSTSDEGSEDDDGSGKA